MRTDYTPACLHMCEHSVCCLVLLLLLSCLFCVLS
jgi:hypothetical protein